ncbi:MAG: hypothetical protein IJH40_10580 [Ruminococcus sp.]|uniref:hypothetical protein n=1 Tax=Ruminococcus sp. TaxID=41978 RepID=UPI002873774B|nr:hypothetical protein [Ruminococcus sp.]MBQ3286064.1 hypothetical protein [Ruminococcus sp.]MBQ3330470.1 hypothetical protein [Ruminococcus sp.]
MSKISFISAIILIAFVLCLSACGESKDTGATPSQSSIKQSASQVQETSPAPEASADKISSESSEQKDGKTSRSDSGDTADAENAGNNDAQISSGASVQGGSGDSGSGNAGSKDTGKSGSGSKTDQKDTPQSSKSDVSPTTAPKSDIPEEKDNAEVNINDL